MILDLIPFRYYSRPENLDLIPFRSYSHFYFEREKTLIMFIKSSNQKMDFKEIWQNLEKNRITDHDFPPSFVKYGVEK